MERLPSPAQRRAYALFAGALCLAGIVAIVLLISKESGEVAEDLGISAAALLVHGLAVAAGIAVVDRPRLRWLGLTCIAVGFVGFAVTASLGWSTASDDEPAEWLLRAACSLTVWSLALAQVAVLLMRRDPAERKLVDPSIGTAVVGALALAVMLTIGIVDDVTDEDFHRWVGVTAVVWVLGTALVPTVRKLQRTPR
jgi:hypothetical protein